MNSKIKLFSAAVMMATAVASARAETYSASIRWDVQNVLVDEESAEFSYAMFKVVGAPEANAYLFGTGQMSGLPDVLFAEGTPATSSGPDHTSLFANSSTDYTVDYKGFSYFVELYDLDGALFARSDMWTYGALEDYVHPGGSAMGQAAEILHVSAFTAVPEPTSGLLFVVGMALLGLKRKRA